MATIQLVLTGSQRVVAGLSATRKEVTALGRATGYLGTALDKARKRTWLMNQAMFTLRRYSYMGTLALTASAVALAKWGFDYNAQVQSTTVALTGFLGSQKEAQAVVARWYQLAALTPLTFKDISTAGRTLMAFNVPLKQTNGLLQALSDMLAAQGKATGASLNRVTVALGHMVNVGHVTGQTLFQLARDGIPVYRILQEQLGLTGDQLARIGALHIPAATVLNALIRGIELDPKYKGAAKRLQLSTIGGIASSIHDYVAQIIGGLEQHQFTALERIGRRFSDFLSGAGARGMREGGIRGFLGAANPALLAIWKQFAAVWAALGRIIRQMIPAFKQILPIFLYVGFAIAQIFIGILSLVSKLPFLRVLFYVLAAAVGFWILKMEIAAIAQGVLIAKDIAIWTWNTILTGSFIYKAAAIDEDTAATELNTAATAANKRELAFLGKAIATLLPSLKDTRAALKVLWTGQVVGETGRFRAWTRMDRLAMQLRKSFLAATGAVTLFTQELIASSAAFFATPMGWLTLAILALTVGLVILYFKWKKFHDLVNETWVWMREHWYLFATTILAPFLIGSEIYSHWDAIKRFFTKWFDWFAAKLRWIYNLMKKVFGPLGWIGRQFSTNIQHLAHPLGGAPSQEDLRMRTHHIFPGGPGYPGQAVGGITTRAGASIVGENGPELLYLPTAATVVPLSTQTSMKGAGNWGPQDLYATTVLQVDGLQLAKVVTKHQANAEARR